MRAKTIDSRKLAPCLRSAFITRVKALVQSLIVVRALVGT